LTFGTISGCDRDVCFVKENQAGRQGKPKPAPRKTKLGAKKNQGKTSFLLAILRNINDLQATRRDFRLFLGFCQAPRLSGCNRALQETPGNEAS